MSSKKKIMQIYIKVPVQIFELMQEYDLLGKGLDSWFIGQVLEEVREKKNEETKRRN